MRFSNEIKAGVVVVVAIGIGIMFFGKTALFRGKTYQLKTSFKYVGGLKPDARVLLSGTQVGRVKKIRFIYDPETRVECILKINASARVREDSVAYISTAGFIGDASVGITPGASAVFLKPESVIKSEEPVQTRLLMKKADSIADDLGSILTEVRSLVTDNRQGLDNIVGNIEMITVNFKEFSEDIKKHPWKLMFKGE
ncbi:MAG: MlaD family protein [Candidatus Omnitrophota bacterium]